MGGYQSFDDRDKKQGVIPKQVPYAYLGSRPSVGKDVSANKRVIYCDWDINYDWTEDFTQNGPYTDLQRMIDYGYNIIVLAFYTSSSASIPYPTAQDMVLEWTDDNQYYFDDSSRKSLISYAHSKGCILTLSVGGATSIFYPLDPKVFMPPIVDLAKNTYLDGIDFDLEWIQPGFVYNTQTTPPTSLVNPNYKDLYDWFLALNSVTAQRFNDPSYVISHAPQPPYWNVPGVPNAWAGPQGGYYQVYTDAPYIDYLFVQFYNQSATSYNSFSECFISASEFPGTAMLEVYNNAAGVPLGKMVFGTTITNAPVDLYEVSNFKSPECINYYFTTARTTPSLTLFPSSLGLWTWHSNTSTANPPFLPDAQTWLNTVYGPAITTPPAGCCTTGSAPSCRQVKQQERKQQQEKALGKKKRRKGRLFF